MKNVLEQFEDVLRDKPGLTTLDTFQLKLTLDEPVRLKPCPTPHSLTETVKRELDQMLAMNVIEPSKSVYASPIIVVKKKGRNL